MNYYYNPVKTYVGENSIAQLSDIIESMDLQTNEIVLLHRGDNFISSAEYRMIVENLEKVNISELVYTQSNPALSDVVDLLHQLKGIDYSLVIGVGGGSIMDISKALRTFKNTDIPNRDVLKNILKEKEYINYPSNKCKLIAIPTTTGTGSEVTPFASLWDKEEGKKYSLSGDSVYADAAIIDGALVKTLPDKIAVSTGLDAMCHAIEAYWARSTNYISRMHSLKAIKLIVENVTELIKHPNNAEIKEGLLMGSFFAGLAFSNTKTTSCHSISYPLTLMFNIPHGIAAFLTLGKMYKLNKDTIIDVDLLEDAFGTKDIQKKIDAIFRLTGISPKLSDYGVSIEDLDELVDRSFTKGRMDNNPVTIEKDILKRVFLELM